MTDTFPWTCPHCGRNAMATDSNVAEGSIVNHIPSGGFCYGLLVRFVTCPNPECGKYTLSCFLKEGGTVIEQHPPPWISRPKDDGVGQQNSPSLRNLPHFLMDSVKTVKEWNLIPSSTAKAFPDYVPQQIRTDYEEACLIADLSPKASASLARRCLQGMIRGFWSVKGENTLYAEIEAIKEKVDSLTWEAIDGVRKIGNIGAHMDKNADLIIEVDADEAKQLIGLIEILIKEWYINHAERQANFAAISRTAEEKEQQRKSAQTKKENDADSA